MWSNFKDNYPARFRLRPRPVYGYMHAMRRRRPFPLHFTPPPLQPAISLSSTGHATAVSQSGER
jgi:hypothetical protein